MLNIHKSVQTIVDDDIRAISDFFKETIYIYTIK